MLNSEQLTELQGVMGRPVRFSIEQREMAFGPDLVLTMEIELTPEESALLTDVLTVLDRAESSSARTWMELQNQSNTYGCPIAKGLLGLSNQGAFRFTGSYGKVWTFPNGLPTSFNVSSLSEGAILCSAKMRAPFFMARVKATVMAAVLEQLLKLK